MRSRESIARISPARSIVGWTVLLLYLAACSPVGLGITAAFGALDRDHHVRICSGVNGPQVVLHHGCNCTTHRHGIIARTLTAFAEATSPADPDHVIQFAATNELASPTRSVVPLPPSEKLITFAQALSIGFTRDAASVLTPQNPTFEEIASQLGLRSTVLLI